MSDQGETARLPLLKSLKDMAKSGAKLDASIVTTYAFNGLFYEEVLLRSFERAGSRLNIVLVDAAQLAEGMSDPLRRPTRAGVDYLLAPIPHVGAFHPKIVVLLSEKQPLLAIGSHNTTDAGYSHNEELTAFWGLGRKPPNRVLRDAVEYALHWLHVSEAAPSTVLKEMEGRVRGLLPSADRATNEEINFLGSRSDACLWAQIRGRIDSAVTRVWIVGPYFDANLSLVRSIDEQLSPAEIIVGLQPGTAVLPRPDLAPKNTRFVDATAMDKFWPEVDEVGFAHGKAIAIQTDTGLVVSLGSANPTGAAWLSQPIWNAEANLCLLGASASAAFSSLGFEGLTQAPALRPEALEEIAIRSQELRRREREALATPRLPVLIGELEEDGLLVAGLQTPDSPEVTLHGPRDSEISGAVSPADGGALIHLSSGRLAGGSYRLCSADETLAFVILNDEQALRAASLPRESARILDHLGALDSSAGFTELLDLLDRHVLSKPEVGSNSGPSSQQRSTSKDINGIDPDVPFGPRGVSMPPDEGAGPRQRRLNEGLIGDIISALIRALSAPPAPSKDGDAQDRDEGDTLGEPSSDQLARNLDAESEQSEIDWPRLVTACRKRLSQMITRLEARMVEASAGTHTPAWSIGRMVVVLSLLQQLRKHPPQVKDALSGRVRPKSLVSLEHLKSAFGIAVRALYGSARIAAKLEAGADTRAAEERQLIDNLLLWFAREIGADCSYQPGEKPEKLALQNRADLIPVAMSAAAYPRLEPWAEHRDPCLSVWDDSLSIHPNWASRQLAFGRLLHRLRGVDVPGGKPPAAGELVQWAGERDLPWVLASVSGKKATLLEPAGAPAAEKKVLVSSVRVLDPDSLIRNFAMQVA